MATVAQCLYCFETLVAFLQARDPLSLEKIEELWNEYSGLRAHQEDAAVATAAGASELASTRDRKNTGTAPSVQTNTDELDHAKTLSPQPKRSLLNSSPGSSSSSSSSSTPSAVSNSSSFHPESALSVSSSRSSLSSNSQSHTMAARLRGRKSDCYPVFVTWNTISRSGIKNLRGCIGTFDDTQPLAKVLREYAINSSQYDSRFHPISTRELKSLECGITLLTDFEDAPSPLDWEIGKHGIRIYFTHDAKSLNATYLPDVAREQGWNQSETLCSLVRKAGVDCRRDEWRDLRDLRVRRYQGSRMSIAYAEWREWRKWVNENHKDLVTIDAFAD